MADHTKKRKQELEELESDTTKLCPKCGEVKPLYDYKVSFNGRKLSQSWCIMCNNKQERKRSKERSIQKFGITLKQYDKLLKKQNGKCKICKTETPKGRGRFHIDHDHSTGKIRGLLCQHCNLLLGHSKDDPEILTSAIRYLTDSGK